MKGSKMTASNNTTSDFIDIFQDQTNVSNGQQSSVNPFIFNSKKPTTVNSYFSHLREAFPSSSDFMNGYDNNSYLKQSFKCKITSPYSSLNSTEVNSKRAATTLEQALSLHRALSGQKKKTELEDAQTNSRNKNPHDILKNLLNKFEDMCNEKTADSINSSEAENKTVNSLENNHFFDDKYC
jgi:hypothetical protein